MPVTWIKQKYTTPKTRGRYLGGEHAPNHPPRKHPKNTAHDKSKQRQLMLVLSPVSGKRTWKEIPSV